MTKELKGIHVLLICIGAAKCATSWLHGYLGGLPEIAVSPLKELHFFNARFPATALGDPEAMALARLSFHLEQAGDKAANLRGRASFQASVDRVQMIYDDEAYLGHFARLCGERTRTLCDITPAYSAIGAEGFAHMRDFCAARGLAPKILFLMRDPVQRFWSQIRHLEQMNPDSHATRRWDDALASAALMARADYQGIVTALDRLFPAENLAYLFYESMFETASLRRLCDFAGAAYQPAAIAERQNETQVQALMPDAARRALHDALAPQYAFCRTRFDTALPDSWQV